MHKMYFNTGVTPANRDYKMDLLPYQVWKDGTLQIEYYLAEKPPDGWVVDYLCDYLDNRKYFMPIVGGGMLSTYAVFKVVNNL